MTPSRIRQNRLGIIGALCGGFILAGPSRSHAQQPIGSFLEMSTSALTLRDSVVAIARAQVGRKFVMGGASPSRGFDCSGLVQYVLETFRIDIPRTSREQSTVGLTIERDTNRLLPGDLLMFGKPKDGVSHVGIYVGHGRYVHASSVAGRVIESPLDRPPSDLIKVLKDARRLVGLDAEPVTWVSTAALAPATGAVPTTVLIAATQRAKQ